AANAQEVVQAIMEAIETIFSSPIADAGGPYTGMVGSSILFDASGSYDPNGTIVSYDWDFDNDGVWDVTVGTPTVTYAYASEYSGIIRMRVTDDEELNAIDIADVEIKSAEEVIFSPESYLTLKGPGGVYFGVHDEDLARVNLTTGELEPFFDGTPFGFPSIDAIDVVEGYESVDAQIVFSVRADCLLNSFNNNSIYAKNEDILSLDLVSGHFALLMDGSKYGVPNVDAVSLLDNGGLAFSTTEDFMWGMLWFHQEDLVHFDPITEELTPFVSGAELCVSTLDAADISCNKVFFSVKEPVFICKPPFALYIKESDVATYDLGSGAFELYMQGLPFAISTIDALSLGVDLDSLNNIRRLLYMMDPAGSGSPEISSKGE
ncbi:MAG: PKD domain-containing protein, partial [Planctomycetota bacterium]